MPNAHMHVLGQPAKRKEPLEAILRKRRSHEAQLQHNKQRCTAPLAKQTYMQLCIEPKQDFFVDAI